MPFAIGIHYSLAAGGEYKPVVLKSHAIKVYMKRDGMTEEEALEFWDYNMAGADNMLIAVDDMMDQTEISEILTEQNGGEVDFEGFPSEEDLKTARAQGISLEEPFGEY